MLHQFRVFLRQLGLAGAVVALSLLAGCSKSPAPADPQSAIGHRPSAILKFHWLGKQRLATEANATNFMAIWNLPESARLEAQTLDKLATAPWRLGPTNIAVSNAPTALLRPLLDDLVQHEVYVEATGATNQPGELVLAIRLPSDRAALWETNLPQILTSLSSNSNAAVPSSIFHLPSADLSLSRSGDWTLLSARLSTNSAQPSTLLETFRSRIAATQTPYAARATNYWIELEADMLGSLPHLFAISSRSFNLLRSNPPQLSLRLLGESGNVRSFGELSFPMPVPVNLEKWNIPTNLVHDPLCGFMAIRGFQSLLNILGWDEVALGATPNQAYFWAQAGTAPLHFFAFPSTQVTNQITLLGDCLVTNINPRMAAAATVQTTPIGAFERETNGLQIRWRGLPLLTPNLGWSSNAGNPFIVGGLFANRLTNRPAPDALFQQVSQATNLVLYDWEITQSSAHRFIQAGQFSRFVFGRARLSMTNNPSLPWMVTVTPRLGVSSSSVRLLEDRRFVFSRLSTLGFTGVEIHLLAEWLESPDFPLGFFTINTAPKPPVVPLDQKPTPQ